MHVLYTFFFFFFFTSARRRIRGSYLQSTRLLTEGRAEQPCGCLSCDLSGYLLKMIRSQRLPHSCNYPPLQRWYASDFPASLAYIRPALFLNIWSGQSLGSRARSLIMAAVRFGPAVYLRWTVANLCHVALRLA